MAPAVWLQGLLLTPLSGSVLRGYNGLDVLNVPGLLVLGLGVAAQLYVAGVNYARNSPEGYNPVADAKASAGPPLNGFLSQSLPVLATGRPLGRQ